MIFQNTLNGKLGSKFGFRNRREKYVRAVIINTSREKS